ncbi:GLUG motif-containing protein [Achromobacter xylosoxidans]
MNGNGGTINRATSSSARVYLSGTTASVGGLVGMNATGATISNSEALGKDVHATSTTGVRIGGLVGVNDGDIQQSAARVREVKGGGAPPAGWLPQHRQHLRI